jgi:hypothetical protein
MNHRRLFLVAVPAMLVLVGTSGLLLWPRTAITRENAAKIDIGMTLAEVETIFGGPERDESGGPLSIDEPGEATAVVTLVPDGGAVWVAGRWQVVPSPRQWVNTEVVATVAFNVNGRVESCNVLAVRRARESPLAILRRWLGL